MPDLTAARSQASSSRASSLCCWRPSSLGTSAAVAVRASVRSALPTNALRRLAVVAQGERRVALGADPWTLRRLLLAAAPAGAAAAAAVAVALTTGIGGQTRRRLLTPTQTSLAVACRWSMAPQRAPGPGLCTQMRARMRTGISQMVAAVTLVPGAGGGHLTCCQQQQQASRSRPLARLVPCLRALCDDRRPSAACRALSVEAGQRRPLAAARRIRAWRCSRSTPPARLPRRALAMALPMALLLQRPFSRPLWCCRLSRMSTSTRMRTRTSSRHSRPHARLLGRSLQPRHLVLYRSSSSRSPLAPLRGRVTGTLATLTPTRHRSQLPTPLLPQPLLEETLLPGASCVTLLLHPLLPRPLHRRAPPPPWRPPRPSTKRARPGSGGGGHAHCWHVPSSCAPHPSRLHLPGLLGWSVPLLKQRRQCQYRRPRCLWTPRLLLLLLLLLLHRREALPLPVPLLSPRRRCPLPFPGHSLPEATGRGLPLPLLHALLLRPASDLHLTTTKKKRVAAAVV
jgi:hypothetical protein